MNNSNALPTMVTVFTELSAPAIRSKRAVQPEAVTLGGTTRGDQGNRKRWGFRRPSQMRRISTSRAGSST